MAIRKHDPKCKAHNELSVADRYFYHAGPGPKCICKWYE